MRYVLLLLLALPAYAQSPGFIPEIVCPDEKPYCIVNKDAMRELLKANKPQCWREA